MRRIILLLMIVFCLSGCSSSKEKYTREFLGPFDTLFKVIMYSESQNEFDENYDFIQSEFTHYHQLFDKYNDYEGINNIKTINDYAGVQPVKVDDSLFQLIKLSIDYHHNISSKVNIGLGSVLEVWHDYRELNNGSVPTIDELTEANEYTNIENIILDESNKTVFLSDRNMKLDVGAVAKGYACELVKEKLISKGVTDFLISAGGNVVCDGKRAFKSEKTSTSKLLPSIREYFAVTIQKPKTGEVYESADLSIIFVAKNGESIVTSGDYERYFIGDDGVYYHHLIDPETLYPAYKVRSITVITEDSGMADLLSTTLFLMTPEEGLSLINQLDFDVEAIWLTNEGEVIYTNGLIKGENFIIIN